ncbi:MAG TPA: DUF1338 domain-containing protein [Bacteroidales bacterium]|nr:MAG: succinyldiaminopimelate aminotransferase [Bacteroidetes bacterium GWF2_33_38]OFY76666.1 MAG: succinyldiaminopimelate aminotransferase [Bacteroidetes bacterium RIFOXYA12_FULL_33_9]HBF88299.1 DUF1338 domain-containing protein [Bacteroidales bacterium]
MENKKSFIFNKLWDIYISQNPDVHKVYTLLTKEGENVTNDHIAYRTFNDPRINVDKISQAFISAGYKFVQEYHFEEKKLFAKHFEHKTDKNAPRVFISELKLEEFSDELQKIIGAEIDKILTNLLNSEDIIFAGNAWGKPSFVTYNKLREESEYAAWVYVFGFCANHFTVNINALKKYNTIQKLNSFLKEKGFMVNNAGGEVKGSPEELLEQSSIMSGKIKLEFTDGKHEVPSCFYEFAKRYTDSTGKLFSGFIAKSANKIFESTNFYKKD